MDISSMLEVQVKEVKDNYTQENVTPKEWVPSETSTASISAEERQFYRVMFGNDIASVRYRRLHCTACDVHIGSAPAEYRNMFEHPVLRTLLCKQCRDFYGDGTFEQGYDATDMFCRWCANGGTLYCCSYCSNTFCDECIQRNFDELVRKKIKDDKEWKCFVCDPTDLYTSRALCWALLLHVQTVNRILQNDQKMSLAEISEKMHLDESKCCPRRRKRKRRRTLSESEEEETVLVPSSVSSCILTRTKIAKRLTPKGNSNGINKSISIPNRPTVPIPIRPRITVQLPNDINQDSSHTMIPCEQTLIECDNQTVNADGTIVNRSLNTVTQESVTPTRFDTSLLQNSTVYTSTLINAVPTATLLQNPIVHTTMQQVIIPPTTAYNVGYSTTTPMVSIPNQSNSLLNRGRVILPQRYKPPQTVQFPSVIELDSDSDDAVIESPMSASNAMIDEEDVAEEVNTAPSVSLVPAVPVALVSTEITINKARPDQPYRKVNSTIVNNSKFDKALQANHKEIETILLNFKNDLKRLVLDSKEKKTKDNDTKALYNKTKSFYNTVLKNVEEIITVNDRVVREYAHLKNKYSSKQSKTEDESSSLNNIDLTLDMVCENDSDTQIDVDGFKFMKPFNEDFLRNLNVHLGINRNAKISMQDRGVQVNDIVVKDYEKCIAHSLVPKAIYDKQNNKMTYKPVQAPDENFGKYEEQFISFLQHIEDHGIETDDMKGIPSASEISTKDLLEIDTPFITEILDKSDDKTSDKDDDLNKNKKTATVILRNKCNIEEPEKTKSDTSKEVDELVKILNNITDNLEQNLETAMGNSAEVEKDPIRRREIIKVRTGLTTHDSSRVQEDDCTIID